MTRGAGTVALAVCLALSLAPRALFAQDAAPPAMPTLTDMSRLATRLQGESPEGLSSPIKILLLLTLLSLIPAALILMTAFTRIVIVLSFIRHALTTRNVPPTQVIIGLSLFLTLFVMAPTFRAVNAAALQPYLAGDMGAEEAIAAGVGPLRQFMFEQTGTSDLEVFVAMSGMPAPATRADVPTHVLVPAFVTSELKRAFELGFVLYLPFLVIDLVVGSLLLSMGMIMLPPVMISAPLKILLFVLVDGWRLVSESLLLSFGGI